MNTTTEDERPTRKKPRRKRYIVTLNGCPCHLEPYDKTVIGWRVIPKRGVLVRTDGEPQIFPGPRSAAAAIRDAIKLRGFYRTDIVEVAAKHRHLVEPGEFKVVLQGSSA